MTIVIIKTKFVVYLSYFELDINNEDVKKTKKNI